MTRAKICGVTTADDLQAVADAGADAVGVTCDVTVETPREVSPVRAADLVAAAPPFLTTVLVTMPDDLERTIDLVERVGPDAVQLHGDLEPGDVAAIDDAVDASVLLAVEADEPAAAARYDDVVDGFVVDSADEDGAGGTGEIHDWEQTARVAAALDSPVILAGGLTPENVAEAVRTVDPVAVDVASGVESSGGVKDPEAVRSFVARARTADRAAELRP